MASELAQRAEGLGDLIRSRAEEIDQGRQITDDLIAGFRSAGLYRALVPSSLGGSELPLADVVDAIERVAAVDGSAGWCAAIGTGGNIFWGYLAPDDAKAVFQDPDAISVNVFGALGNVRPSEEGPRLTGRWAFASNSPHADWASLGAFWWDEHGEMDPIPRVSFIPIEDVTIEDTWYAEGLRGTGSNHVAVTDVPVQRAHSVAFIEQPKAEGTMWRLPIFCVLYPVLGIVPLGIARGAVDHVAALIRDNVAAARGPLAADNVALSDFARAATALRSARAGVDAAIERAWSLAEAGQPITKEVQADVCLALHYGCEVAVETTQTCHRLGGGAAAYAGNPLLRKLLDVQTARQHMIFGFGNRPVLAQALVGVDVFAPPFIV